MAAPPPISKRAMQYWGVIESATLAGESTEQVWARIHAQAEASGYDSPGIGIRDVARLRSQAIGSRNAANHLHDLGPNDLVTARAIGTVPYARDLARQVTVPMFQVKFEHLVIRNGQQVTEYRSTVFTDTLPRSRAELEAHLENDGQELAKKYGVQHAGIGDYQIVAL